MAYPFDLPIHIIILQPYGLICPMTFFILQDDIDEIGKSTNKDKIADCITLGVG